jgi:hypothetical protein
VRVIEGHASAARLVRPDIERWRRSNTGIDYVHRCHSGKPGPHALITCLMHGNEPCGAVALDRLLAGDFTPRRGVATFAFLNVAAYRQQSATRPGPVRFVNEDMNRVWSAERLDGTGHSVELERARALRPVVDAADVLLDLHSMVEDELALALCGTHARGLALARRVGFPATVVADPGHAAGVRLRDYGPFGSAAGEKAALLVECGPHEAAASAAVAFEACLRFLAALGLLDPAYELRHLGPRPPPQRFIQVTDVVTIETDAFVFLLPCRSLETVPRAGTVFARDGNRELRTPYDDCVPIMPSHARRRGTTALRLGRFVEPPPGAD